MFKNSIANGTIKGDIPRPRKLLGKVGEEEASMGGISTTWSKEETRSQLSVVLELFRNTSSDGRFASPSHAIEPKEAAVMVAVHPRSDLFERFDPCIGQAVRIVAPVPSIERSQFRYRKLLKHSLLTLKHYGQIFAN